MPELSPEQIQPKGKKGYKSEGSIEFNHESMNTCVLNSFIQLLLYFNLLQTNN